MSGTCIWCLQPSSSLDEEHIIPQALGGTWTLPGSVVCKECNKLLSHLDRAVSDPFDLITFHLGITGKKGKHKRVSSRGNLIAEKTAADGRVVRVNSDSKPVTLPDGRVLSGYGKSPRNVKSQFTKLGDGLAKGNLSAPFAFDRTATRGVYKIAFEALRYQLDDDYVLGPQFNPIRAYVVSNQGERSALWIPTENGEKGLGFGPPSFGPALEPVVSFRIYMVDFFVDLSPNGSLLSAMKEEAKTLYADRWRAIPDTI